MLCGRAPHRRLVHADVDEVRRHGFIVEGDDRQPRVADRPQLLDNFAVRQAGHDQAVHAVRMRGFAELNGFGRGLEESEGKPLAVFPSCAGNAPDHLFHDLAARRAHVVDVDAEDVVATFLQGDGRRVLPVSKTFGRLPDEPDGVRRNPRCSHFVVEHFGDK